MITLYDNGTIVEIPAEQLDRLSEICRREKISRAEAIRRAIHIYTKQLTLRGREAFGLWKGRAKDGREYEDHLRGEW
jgi:hypothetical protein